MTNFGDNSLKKIGRFLGKIVGLPVALVKALTVAHVIEDRSIPTPWRGKILRAQLVQMKDEKRYVQLLLIEGDIDMRVALDAVGADQLLTALKEFQQKMTDSSNNQNQ